MVSSLLLPSSLLPLPLPIDAVLSLSELVGWNRDIREILTYLALLEAGLVFQAWQIWKHELMLSLMGCFHGPLESISEPSLGVSHFLYSDTWLFQITTYSSCSSQESSLLDSMNAFCLTPPSSLGPFGGSWDNLTFGFTQAPPLVQEMLGLSLEAPFTQGSPLALSPQPHLPGPVLAFGGGGGGCGPLSSVLNATRATFSPGRGWLQGTRISSPHPGHTHTLTHTQKRRHMHAYTLTHTYTQRRRHTRTHTLTHTHTHKEMQTHAHIHSHTYAHTEMQTHAHTLSLTLTHRDADTCTHTFSHTLTHRRRHTQMQTHTQRSRHTCTHTLTARQRHTHTQRRRHTHSHTETHTHTHTHTETQTHAHTHSHTITHTQICTHFLLYMSK